MEIILYPTFFVYIEWNVPPIAANQLFKEEISVYTEKNSEMMPESARNGSLPGKTAPMAFPYVPVQGTNAPRYENNRALERGTLFPGLDLPFHAELKTRFPEMFALLCEECRLEVSKSKDE